MLFSFRALKKNKVANYFFGLDTYSVNRFSCISIFWLKKSTHAINNSTFKYKNKNSNTNKTLLQIKNLIIEISFVILLKLIRLKNFSCNLTSSNNDFLRLFCN
jgi:hypothetical protein